MARPRNARGPARRPQESRPNPFEARLGARKDDVLGRKRKHGREKPAGGRDQGLEKRKGTLLVEYKLRHKGNSFVDRRIGEHDSTLTEEDKAIARFQRQRFKDLAAEEGTRDLGAEEPLFGFGSRADVEASDDGSGGADEGFGGSDDEEPLGGDFGGGFVRKAAGGEAPAEAPEPQHKSKKQVMEELIAKSKAHKAEKAQQRDADLDETEALDRDLGELMQAGALRGLLRGKGGGAAAQRPLDAEEQAYDADRRGLIFEAKAKAGERLDQPEQPEAGEQEEPAEAPRRALASGDADAGEPAEALPTGGYALRRAKARQRQREAESQAAAGEEGSEEGSEGGSEPGGSEAEPEPAGESGQEPPASEARPQPADAAAGEAPARQERAAGTGAFPDAYELYLAEVGARPAAELDAALGALRATVRSAAADGGRRLQVLCGYAVQHFADAAGARPLSMETLDVLTRHIAGLSRQVPLYAVSAAQARLARLQQRLARTLAPQADDAEQQRGERGWPSQRQLLLLQLWATVFPASERRHHVLSPLALLAGGFLKLCPVASLADAQAGLFLCGLSLHLAGSAQRIMPEPLEFATRLLHCAGSEQPEGPVPWTLQPPRGKKGRLPAAGALRLGGEQRPAEAWTACVVAAVGTLARAAKLWGEAESFPEMFAPAAAALERLAGLQLPEAAEAARRQAGEAIAARVRQTQQERRPLHRAKAVKEVKQFNPRFEEEYAAGKSYDPDRVRADERKLKRRLGKEQRGAARELRRDAAFLGDEAEREQAAAAAETRGTLRKNAAWLQSQEADFKSGGQGGLWKRRKRR